MTLGDKLSKLRKENNFTQEQLANVLGVSRQAISKWESDTAYPETHNLIKICRLFQCSTDYLLLEDKDCVEKQNISGCEFLPDDQLTDMQDYIVQCSYSVLFNSTLFWIFSLPLLFVKYAPICFAGLALTLISGIFYILQSKKERAANALATVSISKSRQRKKTVWILWGISFSILMIAKMAALFGSNLWFGRPIEITGPYSVVNIALQIYVPVLTIFIPVTVGSFTNILINCKKGDGDEKEK